jgi:hypothetical protein
MPPQAPLTPQPATFGLTAQEPGRSP